MRYTPKRIIWWTNTSLDIARKNIENLWGNKWGNGEWTRIEDNPLTKALKWVTTNNKISNAVASRIDYLLQYRWDALKWDTSPESVALIKFVQESIAVKMIPDKAINHYLKPLEQIIDNPE